MTIDQETKCSNGPTDLFPETKQCPRPPVEYIFGDAYCQECADKLRELHARMNQ